MHKHGVSSYKSHLEIQQHVIYIQQNTQIVFVNNNKGFFRFLGSKTLRTTYLPTLPVFPGVSKFSLNLLAPVIQRLDNAIQWIRVNKTNHAIHWKVIYPVDSVIQRLKNPGLDSRNTFGVIFGDDSRTLSLKCHYDQIFTS